MKIFPLSWPGKIVLIGIAISLGIICWMLWRPQDWQWLIKKKVKEKKEEK